MKINELQKKELQEKYSKLREVNKKLERYKKVKKIKAWMTFIIMMMKKKKKMMKKTMKIICQKT